MTDQHGSFPDSDADPRFEQVEAMANETEAEEEPVAVLPEEDGDELALARAELAERTADLQRVQAEYLNYKRRVDRDRDLIRENATYAVLAPITEVLDTIDRARDHADKSGQGLDGGLKAVAEQLERIVAGLGLTKFGAVGDAFDPTIHEALSHIGEDPEVQVTTCALVAKAGYRIGDRVVRAAQVLVVDPVTGPAGTMDETQAATSAETQDESPAETVADAPAGAPAEDRVEDNTEE